jgi:hypothetical protein
MAFIGKEESIPVWLPESLPEEILAESFIELFGIDPDDDEAPSPEEAKFGFIIQDWFGPFLMGPHSRLLRGRC